MRIFYDTKIGAVYKKLGNIKSNGVIELPEGINLFTTTNNENDGIKILHASEKIERPSDYTNGLSIANGCKNLPSDILIL